MQGRLSPPSDSRIQSFPIGRWIEEFVRVRAAGLACIEWIYDETGAAANPIATDEGLPAIRRLASEHGVAVRSLCADYFMEHPHIGLYPSPEVERRLAWLIRRSGAAGITRIVLPFVDQSALVTEDDRDQAVRAVERALPAAEEADIELHLELSLPPADVAALLARLPDPRVKINYDSGNSASLGYDPREEFDAYGSRIGSVHVKDRRRGGGTVPLGEGAASLPLVFSLLRRVGYRGDLILQVARGASGDEVAWARQNRMIVERLLAGA